MTTAQPLLYVSRLLPDPVMTVIHNQYRLVQDPVDRQADESAIREGLQEADAAIVTLNDRISAAMIQTASKLKVLANYAVGYNNIDLDAAFQRGLIVTNTPDVLTDATADLTWALLLATARRVVEGDVLTRSGRWIGWSPTQLLGMDVTGKTLGIIGMGRIGQAVAQRAAGFRMKVIYEARRPVVPPSEVFCWERRALSELLDESDFVTIHIPLTPDTQHLIGARELHRMRRTAILINTARGPIVDETALTVALQNGTIAGAGLDVYEQEPALHPALVSLPNVSLLPHLGSATLMTRVKMGRICLENIAAVLEGRPALNRVHGII